MKKETKTGLEEGRRVLKAESKALLSASRKIGSSFEESLNILAGVRGKVITTGIGKSGITARRMASILSSTGTPAFYMHPVEGVHGDIGIIGGDDAIIMITHSGKSDELMNLLPSIKRHGIPLILISRDSNSTLAKFSDIVIETNVSKEACPFNLVPTTSSAVATGICDALAIALMRIKGFRQKDYKNIHPAGDLGRRLLYKVSDLMTKGDLMPIVKKDDPLIRAVSVISGKGLGMACVLDNYNKLFGILTDGDVRRAVGCGLDHNTLVNKVCTKSPRTVQQETLAVEAISIMEKHRITSLIAVASSKSRVPTGIIHMHQILRSGVV